MYIYNRWGELLFHTTDPKGWDGKQAGGGFHPVGVYVYKISVKDIYGKTHHQVGSFTLLR
jgi:hypothetical protein